MARASPPIVMPASWTAFANLSFGDVAARDSATLCSCVNTVLSIVVAFTAFGKAFAERVSSFAAAARALLARWNRSAAASASPRASAARPAASRRAASFLRSRGVNPRKVSYGARHDSNLQCLRQVVRARAVGLISNAQPRGGRCHAQRESRRTTALDTIRPDGRRDREMGLRRALHGKAQGVSGAGQWLLGPRRAFSRRAGCQAGRCRHDARPSAPATACRRGT